MHEAPTCPDGMQTMHVAHAVVASVRGVRAVCPAAWAPQRRRCKPAQAADPACLSGTQCPSAVWGRAGNWRCSPDQSSSVTPSRRSGLCPKCPIWRSKGGCWLRVACPAKTSRPAGSSNAQILPTVAAPQQLI